jgi:ABC-type branched-subunit amino acid transport system substrate-binding protein
MLPDVARRAGLAAEELGVPILTLTRSEDITDLGPHVFRNMLSNSAQAKAMAEYATKTLGYKSFAVLYPNMSFGEDLANAFWDAVEDQGGNIRGVESYDHDQTTFSNEVKKLVGRYYLEDRHDYMEQYRELSEENKEAKKDAFRRRKSVEKLREQLPPIIDFDALYIPDGWQRVGLVAPALAADDIITNACDPKDLEKIKKTMKRDLKTVTLLGSNHWSSRKNAEGVPQLIERGGKFVLCSIYVDGFYADSKRPATKKFVGKFQTAFKETPDIVDATAYDSGSIFRYLIEKKQVRSRSDFREALSALKNFEGATGTTTFNAKREAEKPLFFLVIEPGGVKELGPNDKPGGQSSRG